MFSGRDWAHAFEPDSAYILYRRYHDPSPSRWDRLGEGDPPAVYFWYRQSPRPLVSSQSLEHSSGVPYQVPLLPDDPPPVFAGMVGLKLAPNGRLLEFQATTPPVDAGPSGVGMEQLLKLAGFTPGEFVLAEESDWTPPVFAARRLSARPRPDTPAARDGLRIVAAFDRGHVVSFQVLWPWTRHERPEQLPNLGWGHQPEHFLDVAQNLVLLAGGILLAIRNLRLGRGDSRGALRLALFTLAVTLAIWALQTHHVSSWAEFDLLVRGAAWALLTTGTFWLLYIGLEPAVRRLWPHTLISWNRLLTGRVRDPRVGRDLLVGVLGGVSFLLLEQLKQLAPLAFGYPQQVPDILAFQFVQGGRYTWLACLSALEISLRVGLFYGLVFFVLLRIVTRSTWGAAVVYVAYHVLLFVTGSDNRIFSVVFYVAGFVLLAVILIRFGLIAIIVAWFVRNILRGPITPDLSAWYADSGLFVLAITVALAVYGAYVSVGGRSRISAREAGG